MLATPQNTRTITDMREKAAELLDESQKKNALYILYRSKPKAVLMGIKQYKKIIDLLEDYFDSMKAKKYEELDKSDVDWVSLDELKSELNV